MPVTGTDAILWYNVGQFGEQGYAVPAFSNDVGTLNPNIADFVHLVGRNLFSMMHHEDANLRTPPSINTLRRVHKLFLRASQILAGRAVPPGVPNMESVHVQPGGEIFKVFPIPYFLVRNQYMKRWAGLAMMSLADAIQHTENAKGMEISTTFAGQVGQYITRIYHNMAIELFGKTREEVSVAGFVLSDTDLAAYDPTAFFTQTELVDTVPRLNWVFTEDRLAVLAEGINITDLPELVPWPVNITQFLDERDRAGSSDARDRQLGGEDGGGSSASVPQIPPAPLP